jgi:hypothetical protein
VLRNRANQLRADVTVGSRVIEAVGPHDGDAAE